MVHGRESENETSNSGVDSIAVHFGFEIDIKPNHSHSIRFELNFWRREYAKLRRFRERKTFESQEHN